MAESLFEPVGRGAWLPIHVDDHGLGYAESALYDERGRIGRAVQSLLIDPR